MSPVIGIPLLALVFLLMANACVTVNRIPVPTECVAPTSVEIGVRG